jgi:hypothetical protein
MEFVMLDINKKVSPPLVIECIEEEKTVWLLSFNGPNPSEEDAIELNQSQCFWLYEKIMNIDPNLLNSAMEKSSHST